MAPLGEQSPSIAVCPGRAAVRRWGSVWRDRRQVGGLPTFLCCCFLVVGAATGLAVGPVCGVLSSVAAFLSAESGRRVRCERPASVLELDYPFDHKPSASRLFGFSLCRGILASRNAVVIWLALSGLHVAGRADAGSGGFSVAVGERLLLLPCPRARLREECGGGAGPRLAG